MFQICCSKRKAFKFKSSQIKSKVSESIYRDPAPVASQEWETEGESGQGVPGCCVDYDYD